MIVKVKCETCGNEDLTLREGFQEFYCNECDELCEVEIEEFKNNKYLTITLKCEDLDCVKETVRAINNCVYEECGIISDYNNELLTALLGKNWSERYMIGKGYI